MTTTRAALKRAEQYLRLHAEHPSHYEVVSGTVWSSRPEASGKYCLTVGDLRALVAAARRGSELGVERLPYCGARTRPTGGYGDIEKRNKRK